MGLFVCFKKIKEDAALLIMSERDVKDVFDNHTNDVYADPAACGLSMSDFIDDKFDSVLDHHGRFMGYVYKNHVTQSCYELLEDGPNSAQ